MTQTEYTVIVHEAEEGGYWTEVPSLPGTGSQGETLEEAIENTKEAIALMIEHLRDINETVPTSRDLVITVTVAA